MLPPVIKLRIKRKGEKKMKKLFIGLIALTMVAGTSQAMEMAKPNVIKLQISNQSKYPCAIWTEQQQVIKPGGSFTIWGGTDVKINRGYIDPNQEMDFALSTLFTHSVFGYIINRGHYKVFISENSLSMYEYQEAGETNISNWKEVSRIENPTNVLIIIEPNGTFRLVDRSSMGL